MTIYLPLLVDWCLWCPLSEKANAAIANDTINNITTVTYSPGELVVPGKSPPVRKAKDKAIAANATDLDATALAKDSSSKTVTTATKVPKVAVSKKVRIIFSYFFYYEFIHSNMNSYISFMI